MKRGDKGGGKKGKFKGKGKGSLASRIANSYCRICLKKGHWKNECPSRSSATSTAPSTAPTSFVTVSEVPNEMIHLATTEENGVCVQSEYAFGVSHNLGIKQHNGFPRHINWGNFRRKPISKSVQPELSIRESIAQLKQLKLQRREPIGNSVDSEHLSLFASTGTIGVVDLGASQTVIGSRQVPELLDQFFSGYAAVFAERRVT